MNCVRLTASLVASWMAIPLPVQVQAPVPPAPAARSCVVIHDVESGQTHRSDTASCATRLGPASTFKIPHALVALETGVVTAAHVERWDGTRHPNQPSWDRDHTVVSAMRPSVLWFFQRIAPRIGAERMRSWLTRFQYGNADTSGPVTTYWLTGRLRVSPDEQVAFLRRFFAGDLPVSSANIRTVRASLQQKAGTVENARGVRCARSSTVRYCARCLLL